ncbi:hypothetical protein LZ30DRAFT_417342 [Colletotrichum cereale]|nr:hypothetical protein LZ30DRAFT_417342 [Colletotrichum cereale]
MMLLLPSARSGGAKPAPDEPGLKQRVARAIHIRNGMRNLLGRTHRACGRDTSETQQHRMFFSNFLIQPASKCIRKRASSRSLCQNRAGKAKAGDRSRTGSCCTHVPQRAGDTRLSSPSSGESWRNSDTAVLLTNCCTPWQKRSHSYVVEHHSVAIHGPVDKPSVPSSTHSL